VLQHVALPEEVALLTDLAAVGDGPAPDDSPTAEGSFRSWDHLLFSAKESVYKAWFPLTGAWLGFTDALLGLRPDGTFSVRFLVPVPETASALHSLRGRWLSERGLILTASVVTGQAAEPA
jgi:4'-phosphopantetheinyl transferase EntD